MNRKMLAFLFLIALVKGTAAEAQNVERHTVRGNSLFSGHETQVSLPAVTFRDGHGREHLLPYLMKEQIVILNFIYTSCSTICPTSGAIMRDVQKQLADGVGGRAILVSISVDPLKDTPERLQAVAAKIGAGSNWFWLTGRPADTEQALRAFGVPFAGRPESHPPTILVGNTSTGKWLRWVGMVSPRTIIEGVNALTSDTPFKEIHYHAPAL
jgi:protein SCO1/2